MAPSAVFPTPGQIPGLGIDQKTALRQSRGATPSLFPDIKSARHLKIPQSSGKICARCGHSSCGDHCQFCHWNLAGNDGSSDDLTEDEGNSGGESDKKIKGSDSKDNDRKQKNDCEGGNASAAFAAGAADPDDGSDGAFFDAEQRLRQVREAEAAIEARLRLLRRERMRLSEGGDYLSDRLSHFARFDGPRACGPVFATSPPEKRV